MIIKGIIIGLGAGIASGLVGIGGGIIMIPALIVALGYDQHLAQGTSLFAMLPPVGLLAVYEYYRNGHVNIVLGCILALTLFIGAYFGAKIALVISPVVLKKMFGLIMLLLSLKMILGK